MKAVHCQILKAIVASEKEDPGLQGIIPIGLVLAPQLADAFNNDLMKVLQEIEFLDQEGFVEMKKKPWPGHVTITDLGRDKLRKAHS
jgi:hypothetical protein